MRESIIPYIILAVNVFVFLLYVVDKLLAKAGWWRVPERVLLITAAGGGALGAIVAMVTARHKTNKLWFRIGVPLLLILQISILLYLLNLQKL